MARVHVLGRERATVWTAVWSDSLRLMKQIGGASIGDATGMIH